jgi:hypothetical protein
MRSQSFVYPFAALLGQEKMKKALLLNAVNPGLGGVLIRGEKGTAKSTAVRALAALLYRLLQDAHTYAIPWTHKGSVLAVGQSVVPKPHHSPGKGFRLSICLCQPLRIDWWVTLTLGMR